MVKHFISEDRLKVTWEFHLAKIVCVSQRERWRFEGRKIVKDKMPHEYFRTSELPSETNKKQFQSEPWCK